MELIALLSTGKGTWGQVAGLISRGQWDKVLLVGESYAADKFEAENATCEIEFINVNLNRDITDIVNELTEKLKPKIKGTEVALSIASGEGREHMALISAILKIPAGIKFVVLTRDGIIEL